MCIYVTTIRILHIECSICWIPPRTVCTAEHGPALPHPHPHPPPPTNPPPPANQPPLTAYRQGNPACYPRHLSAPNAQRDFPNPAPVTPSKTSTLTAQPTKNICMPFLVSSAATRRSSIHNECRCGNSGCICLPDHVSSPPCVCVAIEYGSNSFAVHDFQIDVPSIYLSRPSPPPPVHVRASPLSTAITKSKQITEHVPSLQVVTVS